MVELEAFDFSARKEAVLANVKVEVFERSVSEADDRVFLAYGTLGVVSGRLGSCQSMQDWHPDYGLWLEFEPFEEICQTDLRGALGLSNPMTRQSLTKIQLEMGRLREEFDLRIQNSFELTAQCWSLQRQLLHRAALVSMATKNWKLERLRDEVETIPGWRSLP